ncbi:MAG: hypothetical protein AAGB93_00615 [Planctomycetota bacterium]
MTAHRREIREAVAAAIVAAGTALGTRVFENRVDPIQHQQMPAASVFTQSEEVTKLHEGPRMYVRDCELVVEIVARGSGAVDDVIDGICEEVETAIELANLPATIAPLALLELARVEGPVVIRDGSRPIGAVELTYLAKYEDEIAFPEPTDDLTTVRTELETHEPREGPEAVDETTIQT